MNHIYRTATFGGILKLFLWLFCAGILLWYVAFQARLFIAGPSLTLDAGTTVLHNTRDMIIEGTARNVTAITLNNRPIFTDDTGVFREKLVLENGYTIMTLRASDRYGRETILVQSFVYTPAYDSNVQKHY